VKDRRTEDRVLPYRGGRHLLSWGPKFDCEGKATVGYFPLTISGVVGYNRGMWREANGDFGGTFGLVARGVSIDAGASDIGYLMWKLCRQFGQMSLS
jgi:hypothetical protein